MEGHVGGVLLLLIIMGIYFFPAIVAVLRGHNNALAIFMLNLLLGWIGIGWIGALIWACTNPARRYES